MATSNPRKRKADDIANEDTSVDEHQNKKQKVNPAADTEQPPQKLEKNIQEASSADEMLVEQVDLPPEIMLAIFCQLDRKSVSRAGCVCQHWWLISKDESLAWCPLKTYTLVEDLSNYKAIKGHFEGSFVSEVREELFGSWTTPVRIKEIDILSGIHYWTLLDRNDKEVAIVRNKSYEATDMFRRIPKMVQTDCYRFVLGPPVVDVSTTYTFELEFNMRRLERQIRAGEEIESLPIWIEHAKAAQNGNNTMQSKVEDLYDPKKSYLPTVLPLITEQPQQMTGVKLHNYQIAAINWMTSTELDNDKKFEVSPLFRYKDTNIMVKNDVSGTKLVLAEDASEHNIVFSPKGGVLADEMGLGKTMEMLGLMMSNPMKQPPKNGSYFATKATLVLCPNHLVAQWTTEIEKHSEPKMSVVQLTTIAQVKKVTYQQIIDADAVIVSYNLLKNKNYLAYPNHGSQIKMDAAAPHDRIDRVDKLLEDLKEKSPEKIKGVILDHFHWHRIVMDEGHEIIGDDFATDIIYYLQRTYSWYMSGTPFPNINAFEGVRTYLDMFIKRTFGDELTKEQQKFTQDNWNWRAKRPGTEVYLESILDQLLMDSLVWRNTKTSVTSEYKMVDTKPDVVLLDFTPIEAALYEEVLISKTNRYNKDPVRELCCKLNYDWGKTLEEMREFMIKKKKQDIGQQEARIVQFEGTKKAYQEGLKKNLNDYWYRNTAQRFIADYQQNLAALEKTLKEHQRVLRQFEEIKPRDTSKIEYNTKDFWIENYGTKLASLVQYLTKLFTAEPTTRVIIFSQFTDYLEMIGALLDENEISSSTVEGNVHKKTKALGKFKAEDSEVKVILLSLSKAASGTNLIEASHVLLMDPMTGTKEEAQAYENQAIGRAQRQGQTKPVTVVRFIIKNTIEHEYFIRNTGSNTNNTNVVLTRSHSKLVRSSSFGTLTNMN